MKKISCFCTCFLAALLMLSIAGGCVSSEPEYRPGKGEKKEFPPIPAESVLLLRSDRRILPADQPAKMYFQLTNLSSDHLTIYEWRMHESENLTLYYCNAEQMSDPEAEWTELLPHTGAKIVFVPLDLEPGNTVNLECEDITLPAGRYCFYAKLNIQAGNIVSEHFMVEVQ